MRKILSVILLGTLITLFVGCSSGSGGGNSDPTYSISGTVSGAIVNGVTITLIGAATKSTTTDASGSYSFSGLANGNYTVTPSQLYYTFTPASTAVAVSGANISGTNFVAVSNSISGAISGAVLSGVTITLSGAGSATTTTNANGIYSFSNLVSGTYTATPSLTGYTFSPVSTVVVVSGASTGTNFVAANVPFTATFEIEHVATDGNIIIATTGTVIASSATGGASNAVTVCFNNNGTILWQNNALPGYYGKSQIINGNLYAIRYFWSAGTANIYIDKINVNTGAITTVVAGTFTYDEVILSLSPGNPIAKGSSLAVSSNAIYVVAPNDATTGRATLLMFFDLSLATKTVLYSNDCAINDMDFTVAGNFIYQIEQTVLHGSNSGEIDAFTTDGVYFGVANFPETFNNTLANGNMLYMSGKDDVSNIASIFIYDLDANPVKSIPLVQVGGAYGMAFGPNGEMYVAMSNNAKGPVRLDPSTGNISWTGTDSGKSVIYCNGKVFLATGSDKLSVYDAATGNHLN